MKGSDAYLIRDFVPDFDAIAAECAERSRAIAARATLKCDVAYGERPRETLDLIFPDKPARGAPLHILVHGGYWRSGEKANYRLVAEPVIAAGGIAAVVEYDLMPEVRLPQLVAQVRRAARWLHAHAREIGGDPARMSASGHSAGAHLASYLAAVAPGEPAQDPLPSMQSLLLVSGIYELSGIPASFLKHEARMTPAEARDWTPLDAEPLGETARIYAYGTEETAPFVDQAAQMYARHDAAGLPTELMPVNGANHMNVVLDLANPDRPLGRRLADLVAGR